jgi:hypothetical protein
VLVRRDNVEHLIMTGGPVDVVIETGIDAAKSAVSAVSAEGAEREEPKAGSVFGRQNRAARATPSVAE